MTKKTDNALRGTRSDERAPDGTEMLPIARRGHARRLVVGGLVATVGAGILTLGAATAFAGTAFASTGPAVASTPSQSPTRSPSSSTGQPSDPACSSSTFSQAQQRLEAELSARVTRLDDLLAKVNDPSGHLTPADKQALHDDISGFELPGIKALQAQVPQDTTCPQLWSAARSMVYDYRVYVVMTPQTDLTIGADDETYVESRFDALEPAISSAIEEAKADGKDVTAAEAAFDDLKNQVSAAQGDTNGLAAQLLAQTPHGYPGNWQVFVAAHTSELNARTDLHAAYADAERIKSDLQ